ncbi:MAG TPA: hypothetical protein VF389_11640 [Woeseiaceae bacterium]
MAEPLTFAEQCELAKLCPDAKIPYKEERGSMRRTDRRVFVDNAAEREMLEAARHLHNPQ